MGLQPDQQLGHYTIVGAIGKGGMGEVYEATDTRLNRSVAIKVLPPEITSDVERRARFEQEAQLAAAVSHPNVATVYDVGDVDGVSFIVMEKVSGDSLRTLVEAPLPIDRTVDVARGIAAGLSRAHREGVLHRDLKPDNVVLTDEGQPKILDFGLGKLVQETRTVDLAALSQMATVAPAPPPARSQAEAITLAPGTGSPASPELTRAGQVVGTLSYMSPEQVQGLPVDARTDVFSFGVLLYEMLTGQRPFTGDSTLDSMTSILRDDPPPLTAVRADVPAELVGVMNRCLEKSPDARYASGRELYEALDDVRARLNAPRLGLATLLRRPAYLVPAVVVLLLTGATAVRFSLHTARVRWARNEALPEIERLAEVGDRDAALRLARDAGRYITGDPVLEQLQRDLTFPVVIETDPPGAEVSVTSFRHPDRPWILLGTAPLEVTIPFSINRYRVDKPGYDTFEGTGPPGARLRFVLVPEGQTPQGMVRVPAGRASFGRPDPLAIDAFWIDRYEVTNASFKEFVDAGGYRNREHWRETVVDDGRELTWDEAIDRFRDTTGRPGPAGWELGSYPEGTSDEPVGGVSWYEAAAYAVWVGKSLPTVFHWHRAAEQDIFSDIIVTSNFGSDGLAVAGSHHGLGPWGTYDMAGNVREWCSNRVGDMRYILGGAWSEPVYMYRDPAAASPLDRSPTNGFRCMRTDGGISDEAMVAVEEAVHDFSGAEPVDDDIFRILRGLYAYDRTDLDPLLESVDDGAQHWRHEIVTFNAAYGGERVPVHLFLPRDVEPPYQAVVFFPGGGAVALDSSRYLRLYFWSFVMRSGRALIHPVYKGTYERRVELGGHHAIRDLIIHMSKDLQRTIDYLETRDDIDTGKLAYYGLSMGANWGPIFTSIEDRFSASVLLAGGLGHYPPERPPESIPLNFAPRSTVPVLMINADNDFGASVETNIVPMFNLQGSPEEHKRLVILEGGHVPASPKLAVREVLDWLDEYLGPVK